MEDSVIGVEHLPRNRFVLDRMSDNNLSLSTIHVGFMRNDKKGTRNAEFIPGEFLKHMDAESRYSSQDTEAFRASWLRRTVRNVVTGLFMQTQEYKHCELAFDTSMFSHADLKPIDGLRYGKDCLVAYGTNLVHGEVFRKPRTFKPKMVQDEYGNMISSSPNGDDTYVWIHLRVPTRKARDVIWFLDGEVGKAYDPSALERMLLFPKPLPSQYQWDDQKWHCTNLTIMGLQQAGFLTGLDPNCMSADDAYAFLKDDAYESSLRITPIQRKKRNGVF